MYDFVEIIRNIEDSSYKGRQFETYRIEQLFDPFYSNSTPIVILSQSHDIRLETIVDVHYYCDF